MLDTLRYSKRLQSAGVSREQAEAQAEALRDEIIETVATKAQLDAATALLRTDLASVEQRLAAEISVVDQRLDAKIDAATAELRTDIKHVEQRLLGEIGHLRADSQSLRWMIGLSITLSLASMGITAAVLVKLLVQ